MRLSNNGNTFWMSLLLLAMLVLPSLAQPRYTITDLGILPGKSATVAWGLDSLNKTGEMVGYCNDGSLATGYFGDTYTGNIPFLWTKQRGMEPLPMLPGFENTSAFSLNERGQIIGIAGNSYPELHAVLWENGTVRDIGGLPGTNETIPWAINNHGQIAGQTSRYVQDPVSGDWTYVISYPVMWDERGITALPSSPSGGFANGINDRGQISGSMFTGVAGDWANQVAVLWERGVAKLLPSLGGTMGAAKAISGNGLLAGHSTTADEVMQACIWTHGIPRNAGSLGGSWVALWAINNKGQAIGEASTADESEVHAILVDGGTAIDLNGLIPANSGWVLAVADGINEKGQIAGFGFHNGEVRSFLLTPMR